MSSFLKLCIACWLFCLAGLIVPSSAAPDASTSTIVYDPCKDTPRPKHCDGN